MCIQPLDHRFLHHYKRVHHHTSMECQVYTHLTDILLHHYMHYYPNNLHWFCIHHHHHTNYYRSRTYLWIHHMHLSCILCHLDPYTLWVFKGHITTQDHIPLYHYNKDHHHTQVVCQAHIHLPDMPLHHYRHCCRCIPHL